jgi:hypothetical protein
VLKQTVWSSVSLPTHAVQYATIEPRQFSKLTKTLASIGFGRNRRSVRLDSFHVMQTFSLPPTFTPQCHVPSPANYQPSPGRAQVATLHRMNPLKIDIRLPTAPPPARTKRNLKDVSTMFIEYVAHEPKPILRPPCRYSTMSLTPCQIASTILFILYIALCVLAWAVYKDFVARLVIWGHSFTFSHSPMQQADMIMKITAGFFVLALPLHSIDIKTNSQPTDTTVIRDSR